LSKNELIKEIEKLEIDAKKRRTNNRRLRHKNNILTDNLIKGCKNCNINKDVNKLAVYLMENYLNEVKEELGQDPAEELDI